MNERNKKFEDFMLSIPEDEEEDISEEEILIEGEKQKEPEQIEKDDEKLGELMMIQEFDAEKNPPKYDSLEDKYEEVLLLDYVQEMVSKYMEKEKWP